MQSNSLIQIIPSDTHKPSLERVHERHYQEITGAFVYLQASTRADLRFSVLQLSRNMNAPMNGRQGPAKRTLRYLKGATNLSITNQQGQFSLRGYVDTAYASREKASKSVGGYTLFLGNAALGLCSHRQSMVTKKFH
ncbi:unnamed protein product [Discosporangium mesarthrocarpum]